jgi:hypothetical protein
MTTVFQSIIDGAETLSVDTRRSVAQTQSRDGTIRTISQGSLPWRFEVRYPDGPRWSDIRGIISGIEAAGAVTPGTIQINLPGHAYLTQYLGNASNPAAITVSHSGTNTFTITGGGATSGYHFKAGDLVQMGAAGAVYRVVEDVAYTQTTVTVHRPIRETAGAYTLIVGQAVTWTVVMTQQPQWSIFQYDSVGWSGSFVFIEDLTQ